jgi:hypothetical protein
LRDPFVAAVSAALLSRTSEGVADAASSAWSALVGLVKKKLGMRVLPGDQESLGQALQEAVEQWLWTSPRRTTT